MNVPSFRSLSGTIPKIDKLNEISTTTFVVSPNDGLAIILSDDNQLKYSFTKSNSALSKDDLLSPSLLLLTSESKDLFQKSQFSDILLNQDSTKLLLWSRETSIVAYIELNIIMHQNEKKLRESKLIQVSLKSSLSSNSIVKVSFHPLSSHHIVILYQRGSLVLTNLNTMTSQFMSLCRELSFISFSFGPRVDWMIATIFLVEKGGDVYALCPILPSNCKLPERNIEEMYIWLEEQREAFDSSYTGTSGVVRGVNSTNLVSQYVSTAKAYLLSTLSTPNEDNDDYDDDDAILGLNTTNTGYATDSVLSTLGSIGTTTAIADTQSANYKIPSLQGPIKPRRCDISRVATDICVPVSSQGQSVPVLLISYSNGDVDTYLTGCPSNPNPNPNLNISPNPGNDMYSNSDVYTDAYRGEEACGVGPSWIPDEEDPGTLFSYPLPSIQFVECISVGGALPVTKSAVVEGGPGNTTDLSPSLSWQLIPDPVHSSYIHVVSKHDCAAFLLSIRWLRSLISRQNQLEKVLSHSRIQSHSVQSPAPVSRTTTALSGRNARGHITQSPLMKAYNLNFSDEQSRELGIEQGDDERVGIDIVSEQRRLELSYVDEAEEFEFDEQFQFEDSRIISVFCPTQELTTTNTNTVTNTVGNTVANKVMLTGSQIIYDTMMGHVAIFQTSNGMIASINLTSHIQFCESQLSFQEKLGLIHPSSHVRSLYNTSPNPNLNPNFQSSTGGSCGGSNGSLELKIAQKQQYAHEESLTKLFQQAIQGLSRVPVSSSAVQLKIEKNKSQLDPSTTTANSTTAAADSDMNAYDVLLTAKTHFDKEVSLPLQEIAHRLKYRVESLHDLYSIQTKLLSGSTPVSSVGATSTSTTASMNNRTEDDDRKKLYQQGLTVQVDRLKREHENTLIRVGKIQEVYTEQIKRAELLLQAVSFLRGKVTPAEREHYQRLIRWSESATVLENKLESLSQLQARVMAQVVSSTTPTVIETVPSVDATATSSATATVESKIEPVESVDKAVNALTMQLSDDLILSTPSKPDIISSTTSTIPLSARNVSGSKPYIFTSPIITKSGFKSTIYSTPLTTQKQRSVTDSTADMKLTTPLSVIASKPSYVSAYGTPTTFLNQRRGITVGKVNSSEVKNSQCKSPVTPQLIGEGLSESELEQCIKMQGVQTEMLHASVAELKQLEAKLKLLM